MLSKIKQNLPAIVIFVFFVFLYIYTAAPGVYDGDSGEIAVAVNTLGLAHPTGFPLYMMASKLFILVMPVGDVAYRLNIFSGILTAASLVFFYYILQNLDNSSFSSLAASFVLGLGRNTVWSNATTARIYSLSFFLASILLFLFSRWYKERKIKYLYTYSFIWGLSLGTHAIMLIMLIPIVFMLWEERKNIFKKLSVILKVATLAILPMAQYLYIPFAYARHGFITWGDISNINGFLYYITQREYSGKIFANPVSNLGNFLTRLMSLITSEFTIAFFVISAIGLFALYRANKKMALMFILIAVTNAGMMYAYGKSGDLVVLFRYIFLIDIIIVLFIAQGIDVLIDKLGFLKNGKGVAIFTLIVVSIVIVEFKNAYAYNNRREIYIFEDFAHNVLTSIEPNSILFAADDSLINSLWYAQSLGQRDDVIVFSAGLLNFDWYINGEINKHPDILDKELLLEKWDSNRIDYIIKRNIEHKKIYTTFTAWGEYSKLNLDFIPVGNIYQVISGSDKNRENILRKNEALWDKYILRDLRIDTHKDFTVNQLIRYYARSLNNIGVTYANLGDFKQAIDFFKKSIDIVPDAETGDNLEKVKNLDNQQL